MYTAYGTENKRIGNRLIELLNINKSLIHYTVLYPINGWKKINLDFILNGDSVIFNNNKYVLYYTFQKWIE